MKRRKLLNQRNRRSKRLKYRMITIITAMIIVSSLNIAFAKQDIGGLLTHWFQTKQSESIDEIEQAIKIEQEKQTERLKEQLQEEIEKANTRLQKFTEDEKNKRVEEIKNYADEILSNIEINESAQMKEFEKAMLEVVENAIYELDLVYEESFTEELLDKKEDN